MDKNDHLFLNKTITKVNTSACNSWEFTFNDGTVVRLEVEAIIDGLYGIITTFQKS